MILGIGTIIVAVVALVISIMALRQSGHTDTRESYFAAREILSDLTGGEVAHARDITGKVRYGDNGAWQQLDYADVIDRYFVLEWALERAAYSVKGLELSQHEVQDSLRAAIRRHIKELFTTIRLLHEVFDNDEVQDSDSWAEAQKAVRDLHLDGIQITEADPDQQQLQDMRDRLSALRAKSGNSRIA